VTIPTCGGSLVNFLKVTHSTMTAEAATVPAPGKTSTVSTARHSRATRVTSSKVPHITTIVAVATALIQRPLQRQPPNEHTRHKTPQLQRYRLYQVRTRQQLPMRCFKALEHNPCADVWQRNSRQRELKCRMIGVQWCCEYIPVSNVILLSQILALHVGR